VRLAGDLPCCPRCGQQGLLAASVPHNLGSADGTAVRGTITVVLCASCDHDDPAAGPLILYLLVHEHITTGTLRECAALVQRWADSLTVPAVDLDKLEEEIAAWHRGEL
jgi:hypothetical protein